MGCNASKLDRLPAVTLCRDRCEFLNEALCQSYALADAHVAHMDSLKTLGPALLCFFAQFEGSGEAAKPSLPKSPSSSSSSSDSDAHHPLHSESEPEDADNAEFHLFDQSRYGYAPSAPSNFVYSPPTNTGGYFGSKPPSPPPPTNSAWDFLNFFEPYEKYQVPYTPGSDAEATEKEAVAESNEGGKVKEEEKSEVCEPKVKKEVKEKEEARGNSEKVELGKGLNEAVKEVQILFERASGSGNSILEMLDVGKLRYHRKLDLNPVSCKVMHVFTPSNPLAINCMESSLIGRRMGSGYEGICKDNGQCYANLCSTLKKLYEWEKKLYHEVKAEEKLRILHHKKCRELRRMKKKDAEAHKIDSVQTSIGILATKMKISIQVVDKISITISKLREEELWPQINRLIFMFMGMWKDMQECYKCQYQEIAKAKTIDVSSLNRKPGNAHIEAALTLKSEVQKWNLSFSDWIHAQKSHVKALNGWLVKCLLYEPEDIPDDSTPSSPSKIGAPPVFVICNKWSKAMDNISEKNVIEAVNGFMIRVSSLLEKHMGDLQQTLTLDKELERRVKMSQKQEQKMHKVVQARERKMVPIAKEETDTQLQGDSVYHGDLVDATNLQSGLKHIFVSMERFTATTTRLYEELCQQTKQVDHVLGESNKIY